MRRGCSKTSTPLACPGKGFSFWAFLTAWMSRAWKLSNFKEREYAADQSDPLEEKDLTPPGLCQPSHRPQLTSVTHQTSPLSPLCTPVLDHSRSTGLCSPQV